MLIELAMAAALQTSPPKLSPHGWLELMPTGFDETLEPERRATFVPELLEARTYWGGTSPSVTFTSWEANRISSVGVTFQQPWVNDPRGRRKVWVARLRFQSSGMLERYADERSCPAILDVLNRASQLEPARIYVPGMPMSAPREVPSGGFALDHVVYKFRATAAFVEGDAPADLTMDSDESSPVGVWARSTLAALKRCWSNTLPQGVTQAMLG